LFEIWRDFWSLLLLRRARSRARHGETDRALAVLERAGSVLRRPYNPSGFLPTLSIAEARIEIYGRIGHRRLAEAEAQHVLETIDGAEEVSTQSYVVNWKKRILARLEDAKPPAASHTDEPNKL
jgi:hypothetical protein